MRYVASMATSASLLVFSSSIAVAQTAADQIASAGQETSIEHVSPWPPWVTILLVAFVGVFTYGLYYREQSEFRSWVKFGLATIRLALICIVVWMMYGFTLRPFRTDLPDLLLIVDTSQSMSTIDANRDEAANVKLSSELEKLQLGTASRLNQAKAILLGNE